MTCSCPVCIIQIRTCSPGSSAASMSQLICHWYLQGKYSTEGRSPTGLACSHLLLPQSAACIPHTVIMVCVPCKQEWSVMHLLMGGHPEMHPVINL